MAEWRSGAPESAGSSRRSVDRPALVFGVVFIVLAIVLMTGLELPWGVLDNGGLVWFLLVFAGVSLLLSELRRTRHRER